MAGGTSIWFSKDAKTDPKAIFNLRLLYLLITLSSAGTFYGLDSGNIGGILTLPSFKNAFGLEELSQEEYDNRRGTIAAMLAAGGSVGALLAAPTTDFLGRKWSVFGWGIIFLVGAVMQMITSYEVLIAGRFIGGMAVGATSMIAPQFLSENAPKSVRGSMTATYNLFILMSLMLAFWINYGVSLWDGPTVAHNNRQWRISMSIQIIPGTLMVLMVPWVPETARYLINHGKNERGLANLCRLRKLDPEHHYIRTEYNEILAQASMEQERHKGHSYWAVFLDIFTNRSNFQRFFLAVMLFLFHKFTGTDSLNYYAPEIFGMIGVKGNSNTLLTTGVYGVVKFVTTLFYVGYLVDRIGRRLPLLIGATLQATAMLYLALYIRFAGQTISTSESEAISEGGSSGTPAGGIIGIIWIYIYAFGWSFGHSVACYVVAAEIFPSRIRSVCMSFCFFVNWIVDYGITKATPSMITNLGYGTFLLFSMLSYIGVVFIFFCLPELKGRSIESMDDLFQRPLWLMWKHAYPTEEEKVRHDVLDMMYEGKQEQMRVEEEQAKAEGTTTVHVETT